MSTSQGILRAGELLNNTYVIEKLIGSGGTGEVYLAKNIVSGRKFAIKILKQEFSQNEAFINLMRREADVLHNVIDDAVVRYNELLKSEMHGGFVFLVMEFIEGLNFSALLADRAFDTNALRAELQSRGAQAVIPSKKLRKPLIPHDEALYKRRHLIENYFSTLSVIVPITCRQ